MVLQLGAGRQGWPDSMGRGQGLPVNEASLSHVEIANYHHLGESEPGGNMSAISLESGIMSVFSIFKPPYPELSALPFNPRCREAYPRSHSPVLGCGRI